MAYIVPQSKEAFLKMCEESNTSFPYSNDLSIFNKEIVVAGKTIHNRIVYQAMEGCDGTLDGAPDESVGISALPAVVQALFGLRQLQFSARAGLTHAKCI